MFLICDYAVVRHESTNKVDRILVKGIIPDDLVFNSFRFVEVPKANRVDVVLQWGGTAEQIGVALSDIPADLYQDLQQGARVTIEDADYPDVAVELFYNSRAPESVVVENSITKKMR